MQKTNRLFTSTRIVVLILLVLPHSLATKTFAQESSAVNDTRLLSLNEFSPMFLGSFRKTMVIENELQKYADQYEVDIDLARAVCMYESGGNKNLNSWAGAEGYFQVMPATFRSLRVETNIEAGVKYLSQMIKRFEREDYALAAYNGGPSRVSRGRPPLESLQYVLGVGAYRNVLKLYAASIRHHASQIKIETVKNNDDWWTIANRVGVSVLQLRLHNPFLSTRALREGQLMAYPSESRTDLLTSVGNDLEYRTRHGDNYLHLAFVLSIELDVLRDANNLWRLQTLPANQILRIPLKWNGKYNEHHVQPGENLKIVAEEHKSDPWQIIRDNNLFWNEDITSGMTLRVRPVPQRPTYLTHRVTRGDTLGQIATRYRTSVSAIQTANALGRNTLIKIGQQLRIPTTNNR